MTESIKTNRWHRLAHGLYLAVALFFLVYVGSYLWLTREGEYSYNFTLPASNDDGPPISEKSYKWEEWEPFVSADPRYKGFYALYNPAVVIDKACWHRTTGEKPPEWKP